MSEKTVGARVSDSVFESDQFYYSYHFCDKNSKRIPNEMGYRVIKYLKPSCIQSGRAVIDHTEVKAILSEHYREDLFDLMAQHDDPWIAPTEKQAKKKQSHVEDAGDATIMQM